MSLNFFSSAVTQFFFQQTFLVCDAAVDAFNIASDGMYFLTLEDLLDDLKA